MAILARLDLATVHKLARIVYHMLKNDVLFAAVQPEHANARYREWALRNLQRQARKLGTSLVIETDVPAA